MPEDPEKHARESFSFRRMKNWQPWVIGLVAVGVVIVAVSYGGA